MAQTTVTSFYNTQKKTSKAVKTSKIRSLDVVAKSESEGKIQKNLVVAEAELKDLPKKLPSAKGNKDNACKEKRKPEIRIKFTKPSKAKAAKSKSKAESKLEKNSKTSDIRSALLSQPKKTCTRRKEKCGLTNEPDDVTVSSSVLLNRTYTLETAETESTIPSPLRSPKRDFPEREKLAPNTKKKTKLAQNDSEILISTPTADKTSTSSVTPLTARKRLSLEDATVKKSANQEDTKQDGNVSLKTKLKLLSGGKLGELKEKLAAYKNEKAKLKEYQSNKYKITSVISPINSSKQLDVLENKKTVPAYEKFGTSSAPALVLPQKYKQLHEIFRCADTIVSMLCNRREICTFEKLKNGVQDMTRRSFTKMNLGQLKTVYPEAYNIYLEKCSVAEKRRTGTNEHLVIYPNLENYTEQESSPNVKNTGQKTTAEDQSSISKVQDTKPSNTVKSFVYMSPTCLVKRRNVFMNCLFNVVKKYHQEFLSKLNPPLNIPFEKLVVWHPRFPLESVPDIQPSDLPEPADQNKCNTALDVLNKIRGTVCDKVEKALRSVAESHPTTPATSKSIIQENKTVESGVLKGISMDLLQKIRARESAKIVEYMIQSPEEKKKEAMMERIPELVRILRNLFITERKAAISFPCVLQKISDSYHSSLAPGEIEEHLRLIAELFPQWITFVSIRKGLFLKIDKHKDVNNMLNNMPTKKILHL